MITGHRRERGIVADNRAVRFEKRLEFSLEQRRVGLRERQRGPAQADAPGRRVGEDLEGAHEFAEDDAFPEGRQAVDAQSAAFRQSAFAEGHRLLQGAHIARESGRPDDAAQVPSGISEAAARRVEQHFVAFSEGEGLPGASSGEGHALVFEHPGQWFAGTDDEQVGRGCGGGGHEGDLSTRLWCCLRSGQCAPGARRTAFSSSPLLVTLQNDQPLAFGDRSGLSSWMTAMAAALGEGYVPAPGPLLTVRVRVAGWKTPSARCPRYTA
ncbi:hypothetical protein ADL27_27485 [Streptomyces sp. NRRL F-6602]|nr:hypothetical protein ADL27_27485 [Streptomyces sp. NRRL F-6602]